MFEEKTAEALLKEALVAVSDELDKREGSVIYDTLAPFCVELARAYADLEMVLLQLFPQTASRKYLLMLAEQRGFEVHAAKPLEIRVYADAAIENGKRFNMREYNYRAEEYLGGGMYRLVCETAGSLPNTRTGTVTPIDYIDGLTELRYEGIISLGKDEEDTEAFRKRFMQSISGTQAFGGNIADYCGKVSAIDGVGQVKVFPAYEWHGAGTVGVYITDTANRPASAELIQRVKDILDPEPGGTGEGLAPIGHIVDVRAAKTKRVNVNISMRVIEDESRDHAEEARVMIEGLIDRQNAQWHSGRVFLYASAVITELMQTEGVVDVMSVTVNGSQGVVCDKDEILSLGETEVEIEYV